MFEIKSLNIKIIIGKFVLRGFLYPVFASNDIILRMSVIFPSVFHEVKVMTYIALKLASLTVYI